jgi:chemotaxis protein methyltransferase WspC
MGLICGADGRLTAANRYYRKALYLDKNHHDALVHLALLLEQQGDPHGASLLFGRAQKIGARA